MAEHIYKVYLDGPDDAKLLTVTARDVTEARELALASLAPEPGWTVTAIDQIT